MSRKESASFDSCRTSAQGLVQAAAASEIPRDPASITSLKSSEKCAYDSRLNDSGVWSGSNIQSEEIISPESPVSRSGDFSYSSDKVSEDNKSYMRLDSGIDVSVSQNFSELSLKDDDTCNDLNDPSATKLRVTSSSSANINEQITNRQKTPDLSTRQLLEKSFQQNEDGNTHLHLAIIEKFIDVVFSLVRLIPHPSYLNIKNSDRQTPLHLAVLTREPRLVRLLVCGGAGLDVQDRGGNTALHLAVLADDLACVRALIEPVTIPDMLAAHLQYAPSQFHLHKDIANVYNYEGQTCVHLATLNGNIEILRHLLWYGADINAREWKGGMTCLHLAVQCRDSALCLFLLRDTKINAEEMSYAGHTAYQTCWGWDDSLASTLQAHGVDTYIDSDSESDDDMLDISESGFNNSFQMNGLVNVGA